MSNKVVQSMADVRFKMAEKWAEFDSKENVPEARAIAKIHIGFASAIVNAYRNEVVNNHFLGITKQIDFIGEVERLNQLNGKKNKKVNELTPEELKILPLIIKGLSTKKGSVRGVTSDEIIEGMAKIGFINLHGARIRKMINFIRIKNLVPGLVASSKGYYIATDKQDINRYVNSLKQREAAIAQVRISLEKLL